MAYDDDGVKVEVEDDIHKHANLNNEAPLAIQQYYGLVTGFVQTYGYLLLIAIALVYAIYRYLKPKVSTFITTANSKQPIVQEKAEERMRAMDAARRRMQELQDAQTARAIELKKTKEEEKRLERIKDWDNHVAGQGYKSRVKKPDEDQEIPKSNFKKKPKVYTNDAYSPLSGDNGGMCSWRPGARSGGGGASAG